MDVIVLPVTYTAEGREDTLYPVLLRVKNTCFLVDCGHAGFLPLLQEALSDKGFSFHDLTGVIITHHDIDHMGALYEIKGNYPHIKVMTSLDEAAYVAGELKSHRLQQAEDLWPVIPAEYREAAIKFQEMLRSMKGVRPDLTFQNGDTPDYLGGIQIIGTPGHMPGHFSLFEPKTKTLIAADAVVIENGELEIANPQFTLNLDDAVASVKLLRTLEAKRIICYHGGVLEHQVSTKLDELIARYSKRIVND
jgi:glyoxylase-like metal-dependent hydrolase (beta-lactamase superfamily II)